MPSQSGRDPDIAQERINLAFRRLRLALLRSGYEFDGDGLESAVTRAAHIVEDRGERDDFLADCDRVDSRDHWWTEWKSNPLNALREDRFCFRCGTMETQGIEVSRDA